MELDGNADTLEFCPIADCCDLLAVATYTLVEAAPDLAAPSPQQRLGSVSLFQVERGDDADRLKLLDRKKARSGVFDIRWRPSLQGCDPVLAEACADGALTMYSMQENSLQEFAMVETSDCAAMCLSVEWDPFGTTSGKQELIVSHSNGSISLVTMSDSLELEKNWEAHRFEVWSATYDASIRQMVYTGADDSHFCGWDLRSSTRSPVFRDEKSHEMGVCCIQSNPLWENVVATGSYDEKLRLWDVRMISGPFLAGKIGLGGGVWRLKWNPCDRRTLLAACMHNGFAIVAVDDQVGQEEFHHKQGLRILKEYKEHQSLAYGADWSKGSKMPLIATCSFYDRALHLWKP